MSCDLKELIGINHTKFLHKPVEAILMTDAQRLVSWDHSVRFNYSINFKVVPLAIAAFFYVDFMHTKTDLAEHSPLSKQDIIYIKHLPQERAYQNKAGYNDKDKITQLTKLISH